MRVAIWIVFCSLEDPTDEDRHIAVSIDEPLSKDILSEPHKIWITAKASETYRIQDTQKVATPMYYVEIFDLAPGSHYIEVGVTSPPPYYWRFLVAAGKAQLTTDWTPVSSQNYLHLSFNTADVGETGYAPVKILPRCWYYYYYAGEGMLEHNSDTPSFLNWRADVNNICGYPWGINPNPGEQYIPNIMRYLESPSGNYSEVSWSWNCPQNDNPQVLPHYDFPMWYQGYPIAIPFGIVGMLTNNNGVITKSDYATIYTGHVENDAPTIDQFYYSGRCIAKINEWVYVTDQTLNIPFSYPTCLDPNLPLPPADINRHKMTLSEFRYEFEAGRTTLLDPSPGRRIYFLGLVEPAPNPPDDWAAWPFLRIREAPVSPVYTQLAAGPATKYWMGFYAEGIIHITQQMLQQGYFTVEVGKMVPKNLGTKADPPDYNNFIVDEVHQFNITTAPPPPPSTSGTLVSLNFSKGAFRGSLLSLNLQKSPLTGKLSSLTFSTVPKALAGKLASLTFSKIGAPHPPPQIPTSTLVGKLVGLLGPVADAEVSMDTLYKAKTARDGSFKFENVPPMKYTLTAKPTKILDEFLYKTFKATIDLSAPAVYTRIFNMPLNTLTLTGAGAATAIATVALTPRKPPAKIW